MYVPLGVRSDHFQFANNDTQDNQLGFPQSTSHFEWNLHCMETSQTEFAAVDCCKVSRTKSVEADIYFGTKLASEYRLQLGGSFPSS